MTVLYPLTPQRDYTELLYSLRSLEKFLKPPFDVVIVGNQMPDWITNVTQIELKNSAHSANASVRRKIYAGLEYSGDDTFFMNDDFFLVKKTDPDTFPYYTSGLMNKMGESGAAPLVKQLKLIEKPTHYFGHYPCVIRQDFKDIIQKFTPNCINKSAYCNYIEPEIVEIADCKINASMTSDQIRAFIKNKPSFSTGSQGLRCCLPILQELFTEPSKFEII